MNICIISPTSYPPITRGVEIHVRALAEIYSDRGHNVILMSSNAGTVGPSNITEYTINGSIRNNVSSIEFIFRTLFMLHDLKERDRIDIYHIHGPPSFKLMAEILARMQDKPVIYTIHASYVPRFKTKILFSVLRGRVKIIAVSECIKEILEKDGIRNVSVIPTGIFHSQYRNNKNCNSCEKLLFIGNLSIDKGVEYLIRSFRILLDIYPNVTLTIVGDGPERVKLIQLAEELGISRNIHFRGRISQEDKLHVMSSSDLLIVPSINTKDQIEGTPTIILEGMASGLPIIASDVGGIPYIIKDGENGTIVHEKDCIDLANKIKEYVVDTGRMSEICRKNIDESKKYDWAVISNKIMELYLQS